MALRWRKSGRGSRGEVPQMAEDISFPRPMMSSMLNHVNSFRRTLWPQFYRRDSCNSAVSCIERKAPIASVCETCFFVAEAHSMARAKGPDDPASSGRKCARHTGSGSDEGPPQSCSPGKMESGCSGSIGIRCRTIKAAACQIGQESSCSRSPDPGGGSA